MKCPKCGFPQYCPCPSCVDVKPPADALNSIINRRLTEVAVLIKEDTAKWLAENGIQDDESVKQWKEELKRKEGV